MIIKNIKYGLFMNILPIVIVYSIMFPFKIDGYSTEVAMYGFWINLLVNPIYLLVVNNYLVIKNSMIKYYILFDSYNDGRGIVVPDSHEDHSASFDIGARAEIKISDIKLKVIKLADYQRPKR